MRGGEDSSKQLDTTSGYWSDYCADSFDGGTGTESDPYLISSAPQLALLASKSNSSSDYTTVQTQSFKLTADIDLVAHYWIPIGLKYTFRGNFDGNGYVISNMFCYVENVTSSSQYYVSSASSHYVGFFGILGNSTYSCIKNVVLSSPKIEFSANIITFSRPVYCGFFAGNVNGGGATADNYLLIEKCGVDDGEFTFATMGDDSFHIAYFGGFLGMQQNPTTISECFVKDLYVYESANMFQIGGFAYQLAGSTVKNCFCSAQFDTAGGCSGFVCYPSSAVLQNVYVYSKAGEEGDNNCAYAFGDRFKRSKAYSCFAYVESTTTISYGLFYGSDSYAYNCSWYSEMCSTGVGGTTITSSNCNAYSDVGYPTQSSVSEFYQNTTYLKYPDSTDYDWDIVQGDYSEDHTWTYGLAYNGSTNLINDGYPVLTWSLAYTQISAVYPLASAYFEESQTSNTYAIKGDKLVARASMPDAGTYLGIYSDVDSNALLTTQNSYEFVVSPSNSVLYAIYKTTKTKIIYAYDILCINNKISAIDLWQSTYGSIGDRHYSSGNPLTASLVESTNILDNANQYYVYTPITFSTTASSGYDFVGWIMSSSPLSQGSTISTFDCEELNFSYTLSSSASTYQYLYAVYEPRSYSFTFAGAYISIDDGVTYEKQGESSDKKAYGYIKGVPKGSSYSKTYYSYNYETPTTLTFVEGQDLALAYVANGYVFEGWYYSDNTTNPFENATLLGDDSYIPGGSYLDDEIIFAKFKRLVVSVTIKIMTSDGSTYTNSSAGGLPNISYYNSSNSLTDHEIPAPSGVINAQAGTKLSISSNNAKTGYKFIAISSSSTCPNVSSPVTSLTLEDYSTTYYVYYNKISTNLLQYDSIEKYYYFEDGYMPQIYAEMISSGLNATITATAKDDNLLGEYTLENGTTYKLATYNGSYYLGFTAPKDMTLDLVSHETSGTYSFTQGTLYWFRFEPIRWRVTDYGTDYGTGIPEEWYYYGSYNTNYTVVSDLVLWYDCMDTNENHQEGDKAYDMSFTSSLRSGNFETMLSTFATNFTSGKLMYSGSNSAKWEKFGETGQQKPVLTDTEHTTSDYELTKINKYTNGSTSSLRVASTDEISNTVGNTKAKASCLVAFLMGSSNTQYSKYWTRDLGNNLNAGKVVAKNGLTRSEWLTNSNGIRFAYTMSEGSRGNL